MSLTKLSKVIDYTPRLESFGGRHIHIKQKSSTATTTATAANYEGIAADLTNVYIGLYGNKILIDLPTGGHKQFLNPHGGYLLFSLRHLCFEYDDAANANKQTVNATLSYYAGCVINTFEILYDGKVIERIENYNVLVPFLLDNYFDDTQLTNGWGYSGYDAGRVGVELEEYDETDATTQAATTHTFAVPIVASGLLGTTAQKYLPLGLMKGKLSIRLTLENPTVALNGISTANHTLEENHYFLSDVYYVGEILEVDEIGYNLILAHADELGEYKWNTTVYDNHEFDLEDGGTEHKFRIQPRNDNVKSIYCLFTEGDTSLLTANLLSDRHLNEINQYYWELITQTGSRIQFPDTRVDMEGNSTTGNNAEAYYNLLKALHAIGMQDHNINYNYANFVDDTATPNLATAGAIGLNLDKYPFLDDTLTCGHDLSSSDIDLNIKSDGNWFSRTNFFVHQDVTCIIRNGKLIVE